MQKILIIDLYDCINVKINNRMTELTKHVEKEISEYYRLQEIGSIHHIRGEWRWEPISKILSDIEILGTDATPYEGVWLRVNLKFFNTSPNDTVLVYFDPPIVHPNVDYGDGSVCIDLTNVKSLTISIIPYLEEIRYLLKHPGYDNPSVHCETLYKSTGLREWALKFHDFNNDVSAKRMLAIYGSDNDFYNDSDDDSDNDSDDY